MNDKTKLTDPIRGLSSLIRPHFTEGLLLQDDDLTQGVTYTRALSRLMFRTLFGCGVLCGLKVSPPTLDKCGNLTVGVAKGVALDCVGDPVEVPAPQTLIIDCKAEIEDRLWVGLRKIEKCCAPRTAICSPDEDEPASVCTRERDGYEIAVFAERPKCACDCPSLVQTGQSTPAAAPAAAVPAKEAAKASTSPAKKGEKLKPADAKDEGTEHCLCATREDDCYKKHYDGECACDCCECEWIILAAAWLTKEKIDGKEVDVWKVTHSVRRFVRPVLMRDPLVELDNKPTSA